MLRLVGPLFLNTGILSFLSGHREYKVPKYIPVDIYSKCIGRYISDD